MTDVGFLWDLFCLATISGLGPGSPRRFDIGDEALAFIFLIDVVTVVSFFYMLFQIYVRWRALRSDVGRLLEDLGASLDSGNGSISVEGARGQRLSKWLIGDFDPTTGAFRPKKAGRAGASYMLRSLPPALRKTTGVLPRYIPAVLTGLGILGTFWGITSGLSGISLAVDGHSSTDTIIGEIGTLISGLETAFLTSLAGLTAASLLMVAGMLGDWLVELLRKRYWKRLARMATYENASSFLARSDPDAQARGARELAKAAEVMSGAAMSLSSDAIGQSVGQAVRSVVVEELAPSFATIAEELAALRAIKADQGQEVLAALITELRRDVIEPMAERLDHTAEITQSVAEAVRRLHADLGDISARLAVAVETIETFQRHTLAEMEGYTNRLTATVERFVADSRAAFDEVSQKIGESVDQGIKGMEQQREAFALSAAQASRTFTGIREELEQSLEGQQAAQRAMLEEVGAAIRRLLDQSAEVHAAQAEEIRQMGESAAELLIRARGELEQGIAQIPTMLEATRKETQAELERFRLDYQGALTRFFEEQNNLLEETLGAQREGLATVFGISNKPSRRKPHVARS